MRQEITSFEDQMRDVRRFRDGDRCVVFEREAVEIVGLDALLKRVGMKRDHSPLPVYQGERMVGTLPASWDYREARPTLMYDPRPRDFVRDGDKWIADRMLGPGDLLHAGVAMIDKPEW